MAQGNSPAEAVLSALGFALFERGGEGKLEAAGPSPAWLTLLWPEVTAAGTQLRPAEVCPFLENFLFDAEECWRSGGEARVQSGPWVEQNTQGETISLEATALTVEGRSLLLLERLGEAFEAKKAVLQVARENVIAHQRLNSEIEKKEVLLHCVAEEMTAALANIVTSLRLLEAEETGARATMLLELAMRAAQEQKALIHKVLAVFAEELGGLLGQEQHASDLAEAARSVVEEATPRYAQKNVRLMASPALGESVVVPLSAEHLGRIVSNLLENALEGTPAGGEVRARIDLEPGAVVFAVEDGDATMSRSECEELFSKIEIGLQRSPAVELRLRFCRLVVESAGGEIGCQPRDEGGNRFWVRLPRIAK